MQMIVVLVLLSASPYAKEQEEILGLTCQDIDWSDVEALVEPYLDESHYTALVMQGQSAEYKTSEAASMAMDDALPEVIQKVLRSLVKADC